MSEVKGFDLRSHVSGKDGRVVAIQHYRIVCDPNQGKHYIRDGVRYYEDGTPIDQVQPAPEKLFDAPVATPAAPKSAPGVKNDKKIS